MSQGQVITTEATIPISISDTDFALSQRLSKANLAIVKAIETDSLETLEISNEELRTTVFIYFLVTDSLVCDAKLVVKLFAKLVANDLQVHQMGETFFVEINDEIKGYGLNSNDGEKLTTLIRRFLSPLTVGSLYHFLATKSEYSPGQCIQGINENDLKTKLLVQLNLLLSKLQVQPFSSLELFCKAAANAKFREEGTSLPVFLQEFAKGKIKSHSMPKDCLRLFETRKTKPEFSFTPLASLGKDLKELTTAAYKVIESNGNHSDTDFERLDDVLRSLFTVDRPGNREARRQYLLADIKVALENKSWSIPAMVLLKWFVFKLEKDNKIAAETVKKYYVLIGRSWLLETLGVNLYELDGAEMDVLCEIISSHEKVSKHEAKKHRLADLIIYATDNLGITSPDDPFYSSKVGRKYVRSSVIPPKLITQIANDLNNSLKQETNHTRLTIRVMYLLMSRLLLRPGELVRLIVKDVEMSEEGWLHICPRGKDKLKTFDSRRKVPYGRLLNSDERALFESLVNCRKRVDGNDVPLFSKSENSPETYTTSEFESLISPLLKRYFGYPVPIYQFRHTGITTMLFVLFGSIELIETYTPYSLQEANQIKEYLLGKRERDKLWALARLAGHQTPDTTCFSYSHCFEILLFDLLTQPARSYSPEFWLNLTGLPTHRIKSIVKEKRSFTNQEETRALISSSEIVLPLLVKMAKYVTQDSNIDRRKFEPANLENPSEQRTVNDCYYVLSETDNGDSEATIALNLNVERDLIRRWIMAGKTVAEQYVTHTGNSRLLTKEDSICPQLPKDIDLDSGIENVRKLLRHRRPALNELIEWVLSYSYQGKSFIRFPETAELGRALKICTEIYPPERWEIHIVAKPGEKTDRFESVTRGFKTKAIVQKNVGDPHARLYLTKADVDPNSGAKKRYSTSLKYICHMAKVMMVANQIEKGVQN